MKVFETIRHWDERPVTVFASNLAHAEEIHVAWIKAHDPTKSTAPHMTHTYEGELLEARPLLASAAKLNVAGIGYFNPSLENWTIAEPGAKPKGPLVPPPSGIDYYSLSTDKAEHAMMFARSYDEAVTFYLAFHMEEYGQAPVHMEIRKRSRWELVGETATLRDQLEAGRSGMAGYTPQGLWRICEPVQEVWVVPKKR
jgi:hypothetical protein